MTDTWICTLVHVDSDTGKVSADFGGAGAFDDLVAGLRTNEGDVWDNWYGLACLERLRAPIFATGDTAVEARWYALVCPGMYRASGEGMDAVPCDPPAWAFEHGEPLAMAAFLGGVVRNRVQVPA